MEDFDLKDLGKQENIGLNNSKCALAYRVKFGMLKTLFEIMEDMGMPDDLSDDEFFRMLAESAPEPKGAKSLGSQATLSSIPTRPSQTKKKRAKK